MVSNQRNKRAKQAAGLGPNLSSPPQASGWSDHKLELFFRQPKAAMVFPNLVSPP